MIKENKWIIPKARKYKFPVNVLTCNSGNAN